MVLLVIHRTGHLKCTRGRGVDSTSIHYSNILLKDFRTTSEHVVNVISMTEKIVQ